MCVLTHPIRLPGFNEGLLLVQVPTEYAFWKASGDGSSWCVFATQVEEQD